MKIGEILVQKGYVTKTGGLMSKSKKENHKRINEVLTNEIITTLNTNSVESSTHNEAYTKKLGMVMDVVNVVKDDYDRNRNSWL